MDGQYEMSPAQMLALAPEDEREAFLGSLSEDEAKWLEYDWKFWARPKQRLPDFGLWNIWLIMAGRGFGKTKTGAESVRYLVMECGYRWVNIVGRTAADVRDVMIEGESGLLSVFPEWERPLYEPSKRRVTFPNGAIANTYSADEPDQMRGPQSDLVWGDEVAAWRYIDAWDQIEFGNRLGNRPIMILTTTPRANKLMKVLISDSVFAEDYAETGETNGKAVLVTRGSTYENVSNVAPKFLKRIRKKYEGTRLGRQEINAELLLDTPGALWRLGLIEKYRVVKAPHLIRIVVAIDPPGKDNSDNNDGAEAGIVVAGIDELEHGYILDDASIAGSPAEWGRQALTMYYKWQADCIIGEVNNGGDMVEHTVMSVVDAGEDRPNFKQVRATRGKQLRAEPISALYEKGRVHHVGAFKELEDQQTTWVPGQKSPDRLDAGVWALTELMIVTEAEDEDWSDVYGAMRAKG